MSTSQQLFRQFSLDEIIAATRNFDDELVLGKGGFGLVYLGSINDGAKVAIKRLSSESTQGETEFLREIQTLSKLQHPNLVRLEGYCNESQEKILVYEYMPNGTLVDHLYKTKGSTYVIGDDQPYYLSWEQRLKICIGAAQGLDFLHRGAVPGVIHRDIKGSNILLDANFIAKIADFGLAKLVKTTSDSQTTFVSTTIFKGTFGYMDPEYFYTQRLTTKTDIYAFGVVMLVVLSGRPAVDNRAVEDQRSLTGWAVKCIEKNRVDLIVDPYLVGKVSSRSLKQFVKVSQKCLCRRSEQRPTMEEVVAGLQLALKKQPTSSSSSRQPNGRLRLTQMVVEKLQMTMKKKQSDKEKWVLPASLAGCLHGIYSRFSLDEIKTATQDFSNRLGWGKFGKVYLGRINRGEEIVAIRRFSLESVFLREIVTLCKLQHDNIIRLKGYCYESSEMILVYEYMSKGSLSKHLVKLEGNQYTMTWEQRLNICLGVARGLDYLHRVIEPGVIHRDVTCLNIMLDDNFVPKVKDFGLAELANSVGDSVIHRDVTCLNPMLDDNFGPKVEDFGLVELANSVGDCGIFGTHGYMAPEYLTWGRVTKKIDVYSFGVVLLIVLGGWRETFGLFSEYDGDNRLHIVKWAEKCIQENTIDKLIDPDLRGQFKSESLEKYLEVAQNCLNELPEKRHTMEEVAAGLGIALEKQLDSSCSQWVESHKLPNLLCLLQAQSNIIQDEECSYDKLHMEHSDEGEYSLELYDEFLEEYSDIRGSGPL